MTVEMKRVLENYSMELARMYGEHLKSVILYGSYARGDFHDESDIDIMILLDLPDLEIKKYRHKLSEVTFDYNMDYDIDIKPIAKNEEHFQKWASVYPFYASVSQEGIEIYGAA